MNYNNKEGIIIMNQYEELKFSTEIQVALKNYVYRLIDPRNGETFYVGRGIENRLFQHIVEEKMNKDSDEESEKIKIIRAIKVSGLNVIHVIHRHGMNTEIAKEVEAALIDAYPGTTNLAGGYKSNDFGPMNAIEIKNKYSAEEAEFKHNVLIIKINKSFLDSNLYDATRFAWKIDKKRAQKADFILAVVQGIIKKVFIAKEWKKATFSNFPEFNVDRSDRYGFDGIDADEDIQNLYQSKRIPSKYSNKGAANPVRYSYNR